jgi:hypothetical protein
VIVDELRRPAVPATEPTSMILRHVTNHADCACFGTFMRLMIWATRNNRR